MKKLIVTMFLVAGVVIYADAVFARGGGAGGAGGAGAAGAGAAGAAGTGGDGTASTGDAGTGAAGNSSAAETGPGDRLGGPPAGYANDPSIYRSPASAWPGEVEYPSASPRSAAIVTPPASGVYVAPPGAVGVPSGRVEVPATPMMCPGINASDPRTC